MNIADKTLQLKKDFDDVYKAGQSSMVDESKIIEKTVSGEYISVDDVSEIPHEVKVKLTSGGKNLWEHGDVNDLTEISGGKKVKLLSGITYTFSALVTSTDVERTTCLVYDTTNDVFLGQINRDVRSSITFTPTKQVNEIRLYASDRQTTSMGDTATFKDIMIEENDTATEYEPYKETLTDYSGVSLTRCGGNLATLSEYVGKSATKNGITATIIEGGIIQVTGTPTNSAVETVITLSLPKTLQLPAGNYACDPNVVLSSNLVRAFFGAYSVDGKWIKNFQTEANAIDVPFYASNITVYIKAGTVTTEVNKLLPLTLERGSKFTLTEYEPFKGQTLTANADGTVEGVKSTSPYMYMTTDNPNVTINAEYHKSYGMQTEYDRFWDVFQDYGKRTDYQGAFRYQWWTDAIFKPKYLIQPTNADNMFQRTAITDIRMVDLTKVTSLGSLCNSSTDGIRYVGQVGNSDITTFGSAFGWCNKLISVEKMIVGANAQFGNTFTSCYNLESITFEGTIGYSISFADSGKLNKASILSIFNALSSTRSGCTLTLSTTAVNNAFETSSGAADGSTSTEWTNLVATKTNWTISLV